MLENFPASQINIENADSVDRAHLQGKIFPTLNTEVATMDYLCWKISPRPPFKVGNANSDDRYENNIGLGGGIFQHLIPKLL